MRRLASVRVRVAIATVVVVGVALAVGGVTLVRLQRACAHQGPRVDGPHSRSATSPQSVANGSLTREIAVPERREQPRPGRRRGSGRIVAASKNVADDPRLSRLVPAPSKTEITTVRNYPEAAHPLRVAARRVQANGQEYVVYVASASGRSTRSTDSLERLLLIGLPLLALLAGLLAWIAVSLALRPVEAMRQRGRGDRRRGSPPSRARPTRRGRDRSPGPHDERDARPARGRHRPATSLRRRREPRAAQPAHRDPDRARGEPRAPGARRLADGRPRDPRRHDPAATPRRRPPRARRGRRVVRSRRVPAPAGGSRRGRARRGAPRPGTGPARRSTTTSVSARRSTATRSSSDGWCATCSTTRRATPRRRWP